MSAKHTPTPLSRAQNRLDHWREQLASRKKPCNSMAVGSIGVSIEDDKKLDLELIAAAETAVKDWEVIVRAVKLHDVLVSNLRHEHQEAMGEEHFERVGESAGCSVCSLLVKAEARP